MKENGAAQGNHRGNYHLHRMSKNKPKHRFTHSKHTREKVGRPDSRWRHRGRFCPTINAQIFQCNRTRGTGREAEK
eukprot:14679490-Heterocapsa_arctica.AAC.1